MEYFFKISFLLSLFTLFFLVSCNSEESVAVFEDINNLKSEKIEILSFANDAEFNNLVELIRSNEVDASKGVNTRSTPTLNTEFESIFDEYAQAMDEADEYYLKEGGYEEFKEKFPNLYYPEYKDDFSAYLPVMDEVVAKLLNKKGQVIIGGVVRDMRDVFSYHDLLKAGLGIPDIDTNVVTEITTRSGLRTVTLTSSKQTINSKRKAWLTYRGYVQGKNKVARIDVCFRKKGVLGWYNGRLTSYGGLSFEAPFQELSLSSYDAKLDEYSPHKYFIISAPKDEVNKFYADLNGKVKIPCTFSVDFDIFDQNNRFIGVANTDYVHLAGLNTGNGFVESIPKVVGAIIITIFGRILELVFSGR